MQISRVRESGGVEVTDFHDVETKGSVYKITRFSDPDTQPTTAVAMVPGFLAVRSCYIAEATELARLGYDTYVVNAMQGEDIHRAQGVRKFLDLIRQASAAEELIAHAHSLGAINTVNAIWHNPDLASGAVLAMPAGFGGVRPFNFLRSMASEARALKDHKIDGARVVAEALDLFLQHPLRSANHARRAHSSIVERAGELGDQLPLSALVAGRDGLISAVHQRHGLEAAGIEQVDLDVEGAGHNAQMYYPAEVAITVHGLVVRSRTKVLAREQSA